MGSADVLAGYFSGGGGSGGSASTLAGYFSGGGGGGTRKLPAPEDQLTSSLVRLARTLPRLKGSQADSVRKTIYEKSKGLSSDQMGRVVAATQDSKLRGALQMRARGFSGHSSNPIAGAIESVAHGTGDVLSGALDVASRPGRFVLSGIAEWARQGEAHPVNAGPLSIRLVPNDLGMIFQRAFEGGAGRRVDTPMSIARETVKTRAEQGVPEGPFMAVHATPDNPLGAPKALRGASNIAFDFAGSLGTDPLTYATFGLSQGAKVGLKAATETLGAERAAVLAEKGLGALTDAERARLAEATTPKVMEALGGVRGGVKVRLPSLEAAQQGRFLGPERTVVPGLFAKSRAASIIERAGGMTAADAEAAKTAAQMADYAGRGAQRLHASADLVETSASDAKAAERAASMRQQARLMDALASQSADEAAQLAAGGRSAVARAVERLRPPGGLADTISRAADRIPGARTAAELFKPREAVRRRFGERAAEAIDDARVRYRGTYNASLEDDLNKIMAAARNAKVTPDELEHVIGPALDIGGDASHLPDRLRKVYNALAEVRDRFTNAQIEAGVMRETATHLTSEYLPRVLTEEGAAWLGQKGGDLAAAVAGASGPSVTRGLSGHLRRRVESLVDIPIHEINARLADQVGGNLFEPNPLTAITKRAVEANRDVATRNFVADIANVVDEGGHRLVLPLDEGSAAVAGTNVHPAGVTLPQGYVEVKVPKVGTFGMPQEIAGEAKRAFQLIVNDQALNKFIRGLDRWMTLWKGYATVPLPFGLGFHERNAMGNVFNNWLAHIMPTDPAYTEAAKIQRLMKKGAKEGDVLKYLTGRYRKIVEDARKYDIVGEGFFGIDLGSELGARRAVNVAFRDAGRPEQLRRIQAAANPLNPSNALIAIGRKFGKAIEENARLAHFIAKQREFGSAAEAARSVRKYLFDYSDLTAAEQHVFKRFMAFYTFTRKNLPLQVASALQTPGKLSHLQAARIAVADQSEAPQGLYPSYLPEIGGVPLPMGVSAALSKVPGLGLRADQQLVFAPDLPITNATNVLTPAAQLLASLPLVDRLGLPKGEGPGQAFSDLATQGVAGGAPGAFMAAIQAFGAGKEFFTGRPLTGRNVQAPVYAVPFARQRVINGERVPAITDRSRFLAESLFPLLGKVGSTFPTSALEAEKAPRRRLSTFTGLRVYPLGPGTSQGEALRRQAAVDKLIADLKAAGIDVASARTKRRTLIHP